MKRFSLVCFISFFCLYLLSCSDSAINGLTQADSLKIYDAIKLNRPATVRLSPNLGTKFFSSEFPGGRIIDTNEAKGMIRNFRTESDADPEAMQNGDNEKLRGFFISRAAFDTLLKDKPYNGVMVYFAKHDSSASKVYTLVFVGTKMDIATKQGTDYPAGGMWEEIDPCLECAEHWGTEITL